jgi:hypothetical protein
MCFLRKWELRKGSNPGGFVVSGLLLKEPRPAVQSLPSGLGKPIAVIKRSHVDALLL